MKTAIFATLLALAPAARTQVEPDRIWSDPVFKKQFVAGYGVNADVEPRITPAEVAVLEKILPLMAEDLPKAEATLRPLIKPDSSATLDFTLGGILFQQDKLADALASYRTAVGKFPSFRRAWRNLGFINARNNDFDQAIVAFTKMIELGGADAFSYGLLGFAYSAKQDFQPAEVAYRTALLLQPDNTQWRLGLTDCVLRQGKYEDAASLLDVLIARYPDKADFWLLQAKAYISLKSPLKAAENLESLSLLGKATADSLHTLGDLYSNESLLPLATRAYLRAIDADPAQPLAKPLRAAELLAARGALAESRQVAQRIHQGWDTTMAEADRRRLLKLEARVGMAEGAADAATVAVLDEIVKLDPLDGEALMLLGQHWSRSNEPDKAIFFYERAESLEAFEANAKIRHAQVLVGMSRYGEALPLLRRAQEIKPREDVARYLEQVERIAKAKR